MYKLSCIIIGALGAPSILVSMMAGNYIEELMKLPGPISIEIIPNTDDVLTKAWIDLAFTSFEGTSFTYSFYRRAYMYIYIHT